MEIFLIRSATFQSNSYPVVLMRLDGSCLKLNLLLKLWKCRVEPATSWLVVRNVDHSVELYDNNNQKISGIIPSLNFSTLFSAEKSTWTKGLTYLGIGLGPLHERHWQYFYTTTMIGCFLSCFHLCLKNKGDVESIREVERDREGGGRRKIIC